MTAAERALLVENAALRERLLDAGFPLEATLEAAPRCACCGVCHGCARWPCMCRATESPATAALREHP